MQFIMKFLAIVSLIIVILLHLTAGAKVKPCLCSLPHSQDGYDEPVVWRCNGQLPLWSYNKATNECLEFRYGGCGGNDNSFSTKEACEATCKS